ncbi:MAG: glycosyltransferase family 39 protein [Elusimicrobia bacterium]|nr:glycosyltransferase family 39 protein [Elusimicrobiota bacterium]
MIKKSVLLKISFIPVIGLSAFFCFRGLEFGLPSAEQNKLLFSGQEEMNALIPLMAKRRQKIYAYYSDLGERHLNQHFDQTGFGRPERITITLSGRKILIPEEKLDTMRSFMLHSRLPDEPFILKVISMIRWQEFDFNPRFFVYGGGFLYPVGAAYKISSMLGLSTLTGNVEYYLSNPSEAAKLYLVPKILSILAFILSIPLFFLLARELYDSGTGFLACIFYAFCPIITTYTHFFKPHALVLLPVVISMLAGLKLLNSGGKKWYFASGLFAGFAAGTFSFAGAVILCAVGGHILRCRSARDMPTAPSRRSAGGLFILAGAAIAGFFLLNPYWLMDYKSVWNELQVFFARSAPRGFSIREFAVYCFMTIPNGAGWAVGILFFSGLSAAFIKRTKADLFLLSLLVPFIIYAGQASPHWWHGNLHMSMVIVPAVILLAARFCSEFLLNGKFRPLAALAAPIAGNAALFRRTGILLTASAAFYTALNSFYYAEIFASGDNKLKAGEWINRNVKPGSAIGASNPFFSGYNGYPPFRQTAYELKSGQAALKNSDFYITVGRPEEKEQPLPASYALEKKFSREHFILDAIFSNRIIPFADADVVIYGRNSGSGAEQGASGSSSVGRYAARPAGAGGYADGRKRKT